MKKLQVIKILLVLTVFSVHSMQKSLPECYEEREKLHNDLTRITISLRAGDIDSKQAISESYSIMHRWAQLEKELQAALPYERDEHTKNIDAHTQEYLANEEKKLQSLMQAFPSSTQELFDKLNELWPNK